MLNSSEGGSNIKERELDFAIQQLFKQFKWLAKKLDTLEADDSKYLKTVDAETKVGALLRDLVKMRGVEGQPDSLAMLFAKLEDLPNQVAKKVSETVIKHGRER